MKAKIYIADQSEPKRIIPIHTSPKKGARYWVKSGSDGYHVNSKEAVIQLLENIFKAIINKGGKVELD